MSKIAVYEIKGNDIVFIDYLTVDEFNKLKSKYPSRTFTI